MSSNSNSCSVYNNNPRKQRGLLGLSKKLGAASAPPPVSVSRLEKLLDRNERCVSQQSLRNGPTKKKRKITNDDIETNNGNQSDHEKQRKFNTGITITTRNSALCCGRDRDKTKPQKHVQPRSIKPSKSVLRAIRLKTATTTSVPIREKNDVVPHHQSDATTNHVLHSLSLPLSLPCENKQNSNKLPSKVESSAKISIKLSKSFRGIDKGRLRDSHRYILPTTTTTTVTKALSLDSCLPLVGKYNSSDDDATLPMETHRFPTTNTSITTSMPTTNTYKQMNSMTKEPFGRSSFTNNNDNFVRLNLKNNAGACRGDRNKKRLKRGDMTQQRQKQNNHNDKNDTNDDDDNESSSGETHEQINRNIPSISKNTASYVSRMTGLDPMDEFVDGVFNKCSKQTQQNKLESIPMANVTSTTTAPNCVRHQRPCKLVVVKKTTTGNKGRKFYSCSMPRGEQCNHFQWADDTAEAARQVLANNSHHSSFISRQVAAHVDRFRTLTVPELRQEAASRNLNKTGKKQQLLMRLAIWARDEIVKSAPHLDVNYDINHNETNDDTDPISIQSKSMSEEVLHQETTKEEIFNVDEDCSSDSSDEGELQLVQTDTESTEATDEEEEEKKEQIQISGMGSTNNVSLEQDENNCDASLLESLQTIFGYHSFRIGQEWAVQRCLEGKRSLLVAPTGFGKSLCYALPAALLHGVCIVVSPLISLIQDQLRALPPRIPAATMSGSTTTSTIAAILDDIIRNRLKILFVSPERLTSPAFRRLFLPSWDKNKQRKERAFPEISLLCIDEAHCISQWAHNFRPCFLRFKSFLRLMQPRSVLAITATAGSRVIQDIKDTLDIGLPISQESSTVDDHDDCIRIINSGRNNIDVKVTFLDSHEERLETLVGILSNDNPTPKSKKKEKSEHAGKLSKGSVIVYVWRKKDTEVVAEYLNAAGVAGGVVIYHGGMDLSARAKSQSRFMRGKARICVATIAFGLGIDKKDVEGIIHLYLSNSPEHYLQEIGRAGRDGRPALAVALPLLEEVPIRHSLSHSNLVSKSQIRSLLRRLRALANAAAETIGSNLYELDRVLHVALPLQAIVLECDCKPETIETCLSLIETSGDNDPLFQVQGLNYDCAIIAMKRRPLKKLAEREEVANSILAVCTCLDAPLSESDRSTAPTNECSFQRQFLAYSMGSFSFSIASAANKLGELAEPRHIFAALRRLQSANELELCLNTSESGRAFHLKITESGCRVFGSEEEYNKVEEMLTNTLYESFCSSSASCAEKVLDMHYILDQVSAVGTSRDTNEKDNNCRRSSSLIRFQELVDSFFDNGIEKERIVRKHELLPKSFYTIRREELRTDTGSLLREPPQMHCNQATGDSNDSPRFGKDCDYTSLAITKFLHGIESPRTPHLVFRNHPLYGKWRQSDFNLILGEIHKIIES